MAPPTRNTAQLSRLPWIERDCWSTVGDVAALMSALAADHVSTMAPSWELVVFTLLVCVALACAIVTAIKGRWGWLVLGLMTAGLLWIVGALQPPAPSSLLQRWRSVRVTRHHA